MNMAYCMLHHEGNGNACLKDKLIFYAGSPFKAQ